MNEEKEPIEGTQVPCRYLSGWRTEFRCGICKHTVSEHTMMCSHGRCPYCGRKGPNACTIMSVTEHIYRLVSHSKWWQFWIKPVRQYK